MALLNKTQFRLTIDGVPVPGTNVESTFTTIGDNETIAIIGQKIPVAAGAHIVRLQWRSNPDGASSICRPVTRPNEESATLFASEVSP